MSSSRDFIEKLEHLNYRGFKPTSVNGGTGVIKGYIPTRRGSRYDIEIWTSFRHGDPSTVTAAIREIKQTVDRQYVYHSNLDPRGGEIPPGESPEERKRRDIEHEDSVRKLQEKGYLDKDLNWVEKPKKQKARVTMLDRAVRMVRERRR